MKQVYGFTPERFRKTLPATLTKQLIILKADYRPPFDWEGLLAFLAPRTSPLESVRDSCYYRIIDGHEIRVSHLPAKHRLHIAIPPELSHQTHLIVRRTRQLFDLDANPTVIAEAFSDDLLLGPLAARYPGIRLPGCWDRFELLIRAIIGQQVSVAGATTLMSRLVTSIGIQPEAIVAAPDAVAKLGMPRKRAATIWRVAQAVHSGKLELEHADPASLYTQLLAIEGIGPWTAEYVRLRALGFPDAFPAGDLGLQKAIAPGSRLSERELLAHAETWRPWRGYAALLLWKSLNKT